MLSALGLTVLFAVAVACVFLPYYWVARSLQKRLNLKTYFLPLISLAVSSLVAYLGLYTYYLSSQYIIVFQTITILSALVSLFILFRQRPTHIRKIPFDISIPIILIFLITSLYGTISMSCSIGI